MNFQTRFEHFPVQKLDMYRQDSYYSLTLHHEESILKEFYVMPPDTFQTELRQFLREDLQGSRRWRSYIGQGLTPHSRPGLLTAPVPDPPVPVPDPANAVKPLSDLPRPLHHCRPLLQKQQQQAPKTSATDAPCRTGRPCKQGPERQALLETCLSLELALV